MVSESHQVAGVAVVGRSVGNLWKNRRYGGGGGSIVISIRDKVNYYCWAAAS